MKELSYKSGEVSNLEHSFDIFPREKKPEVIAEVIEETPAIVEEIITEAPKKKKKTAKTVEEN